jgi:hypothetical protein
VAEALVLHSRHIDPDMRPCRVSQFSFKPDGEEAGLQCEVVSNDIRVRRRHQDMHCCFDADGQSHLRDLVPDEFETMRVAQQCREWFLVEEIFKGCVPVCAGMVDEEVI